MKKAIVAFFCFALVLSLFGCGEQLGKNTDNMKVSTRSCTDQLSLSLVEGSLNSKKVTFYLRNSTEYVISYGYGHVLETQIDGVWYVTDYGPENAPAGATLLEPGEEVEIHCPVSNSRQLPSGIYRVLIEACFKYDEGSFSEVFHICGEFSL